MRITRLFIFCLVALAAVAPLALSAPEGWHTSMKDGFEAAKKSGKPLLLVTAWKDKI